MFLLQILLSLPCINPQELAAFEEALAKTASPKEQKQHMKSLLLLGTGNKLKALVAQKSVNIITNVSGNSLPPALFRLIQPLPWEKEKVKRNRKNGFPYFHVFTQPSSPTIQDDKLKPYQYLFCFYLDARCATR